VTIHRLLVVSKRRDAVVLDVTCSAGTYIRSLAHDIGAGLGCPAVVSSLRRLESQPFTLDAAASYEGLLAGRLRLEEHVRPLEECLPPLPCRALTLAEQVAVMHGSAFAAADCPPGPLLLLSPGGKLLAVGEGVPEQQVIRVKRVITTD
jgi:tRNA pseudouridine55 synthase